MKSSRMAPESLQTVHGLRSRPPPSGGPAFPERWPFVPGHRLREVAHDGEDDQAEQPRSEEHDRGTDAENGADRTE
jgi:hypothetical protein